MHRLGTSLNDEQLAAPAVLGPFDVHWRVDASLGRVVILDDRGPSGELQNLVIGDAQPLPIERRS